jgi:putative zinc finger/helix-turn-helix YgiT family protein
MDKDRKPEIEMPKLTCLNCEADDITTSLEKQIFLYGKAGTPLSADVPVRTCRTCGFQFTDFEAEDAREQAIRDYLDVPAPQQIQDIRKKYDMARAEFSEISGIGEASLGRWESGALIPSVSQARYLFLLRYEDNILRLRERFVASSPVGKGTDPLRHCRVFKAIGPQLERVRERASRWQLCSLMGR